MMTESRRLGKQFGWRYLTELSQKPPPDTLSYPQSESRIIFDRRDYCVSVLAMTRPACNIVKNLIIKTFDNKSIYSKWYGIPLMKISCNDDAYYQKSSTNRKCETWYILRVSWAVKSKRAFDSFRVQPVITCWLGETAPGGINTRPTLRGQAYM